jgi:hypothetical protein
MSSGQVRSEEEEEGRKERMKKYKLTSTWANVTHETKSHNNVCASVHR